MDEARRKQLEALAGGGAVETSTARAYDPTSTYPGQIFLESLLRKAGKGLRLRETARALEASYGAKTAQAARGFGDTANVAVEERKMMQESFPKDENSYEGRDTLEASLLLPGGFFDDKEKMLNEIINKPTPLMMKGVSKSGPRYETDPTILADKRQAITDLSRLRQTRQLYKQMYEEANQKMPPIGAKRSQEAPASIGPTLMQDAKGRKAYVYPDGRVEPIP